MRIEHIVWHDAHCPADWTPSTEVPRHPNVVASVGYVVAESEDAVTITNAIADGPGGVFFNDPLVIPKIAIISRGEIPRDA